jgi:dTDP-4-amino-4,6-dideoxygalactose transaminase
MDTLQSAILLAKFDIFPDEIELRQKVVEHYTNLLAPCSMLDTPCVSEGYKSVWAQYSVLAKDEQPRSAIQAKLKDAGIPTAIYYPKPLHLQDAFAFLGHKEGEFPISESISKRIFSLPMHPYLQAEDQQRIAEILNE